LGGKKIVGGGKGIPKKKQEALRFRKIQDGRPEAKALGRKGKNGKKRYKNRQKKRGPSGKGGGTTRYTDRVPGREKQTRWEKIRGPSWDGTDGDQMGGWNKIRSGRNSKKGKGLLMGGRWWCQKEIAHIEGGGGPLQNARRAESLTKAPN